jgi:hyperosmotically inducible periplasmic protein
MIDTRDPFMRFIRTIFLLLVIVVVGVFAYNYWSGNGWTLRPSAGAAGIDADTARRRGAEVATETARKAGDVATKVEAATTEGALTAKIKSKMVLDDYVKARTINVDTKGSVVTLTGVVGSTAERDRSVRLAKETTGVTQVVDKLEIRKE